MKIVSACLAGINCKYNGKNNSCPKIVKLVKEGKAIPVCAEQLGGLATPRDPAEIQKNKVKTKKGKDVTKQFEKGAEEALKIAKMTGCTEAILKEKSPSCGSKEIYDGTFTKTLKKGSGIFAQKLKDAGIAVKNENTI